ncbi:ComEC/Rec2 family competence protein [Arthrobacter globiformis]|uniref:ComEC/Rec2 family competence protein n=1 Tax=Arthrobacter globiformis TaxID=1665 RepID=UPI002786D237|nr:ComEC/Rec2 family competence protein [Arthrobacter globiformis]MDQ0865466.1 competence protein ComEC [Arthrobacter globiformis]
MDGRNGRAPSRWHRYVEAAVDCPRAGSTPGEPSPGDSASADYWPSQPTSRSGPARALGQKIRADVRRRLLPDERDAAATESTRRRTDLRLAPAALLVWTATVAAPWLTPATLLLAWGGLAMCAGALLAIVLRRKKAAGHWRHSFLTTLTAALMLAAASTAHSAVSSAQRHDEQVAGLVEGRASVVAEAEIGAAPRALKTPGPSGRAERWAVAAVALSLTSGGQVTHARLPVVIIGGQEWQGAGTGQVLRVTGKLRPPDAGRVEAAILSASSPPVRVAAAQDWQQAPAALGKRFASDAAWLAPDARGLLPGMVTGDTGGLSEELETAMKTVGLTHLTAVSGANCSLILGALLLAARSLRLARRPAAAVALSGLGLFVLMVGPDASVLRASLMGAVAVASLAGGRAGRGLSFLCLAVIALLLVEPELGVSFGFLLSVLATLGIIVLGRCVMGWFPASVPRWVAAAIAVPLSAQVLCGPVIVVLQPQFSTYSLLANVLVAPLVAPVTILGTAAVALLPFAPWLAAVLIGVAGFFAGGVASIARFTAGLPGAAPPWPEGVFGLLTMVLFSIVTLLAVWMAAHPAGTIKLVLAAHAGIVRLLDRLPEATLRRGGPSGHGRLRVCNLNSGRNHQWPLPSNDRRRRQPIRRPGGT